MNAASLLERMRDDNDLRPQGRAKGERLVWSAQGVRTAINRAMDVLIDDGMLEVRYFGDGRIVATLSDKAKAV